MTHPTVVVLATIVALLAAGCGSADRQPTSSAAAGAANCEPVVYPPLQGGQHLLGDRPPPVPYSSTPPTSGWHASGVFTIGVHPPDGPLPEPKQVSVLEAGGGVVTHGGLPEADRRRLEDHVRTRYDGRVAVTPYAELEGGEVALAAWGALQRCERLDLSTVDAFVATYADERPAVPGTD